MTPLDQDGCRRLADVVGESPWTVIAAHALRTGRCRAYVLGEIERFEGAIVDADYCRGEPIAFGKPEAIWELAAKFEGLSCVEVRPDMAQSVADLLGRHSGWRPRLYGDLFFSMDEMPREFSHPAVRMMTVDDLDASYLANAELLRGNVPNEQMVREGLVACATIKGRLVARVEAYAMTETYANLGAGVLPEFRKQGICTAAACLLTKALIRRGQVAVWSTGEDNFASQGVVRKLGFKLVDRGTYVIRDR